MVATYALSVPFEEFPAVMTRLKSDGLRGKLVAHAGWDGSKRV